MIFDNLEVPPTAIIPSQIEILQYKSPKLRDISYFEGSKKFFEEGYNVKEHNEPYVPELVKTVNKE